MTDELARQISALLDVHHVMSLATRGPGGPHAANLFYARRAFVLFWVSDPASRHSVELAADARVAATIATDYSDFPSIKGLQVAGRAERIADQDARSDARRHLEQRYSFLQAAAQAPAELHAAYERADFYRLIPHRIVLIDNTRGLGFKQTLELGQDGRPG
jgi:uncharacterized protein YhbP (UPF0306 family)